MNQAIGTLHDLRINADRKVNAFNELARIGATADGGVNRPTFSDAPLASRSRSREPIAMAALGFRTDGAGNHSALLALSGGSGAEASTLLLGSHLDSVPNGGRFDGALGVMAAFEVLRTIKEAGLQLRVNLEAIDFTDEEGTLVGLLGSAAVAGRLHPDVLQNP